jgi:hypothetical protein
MNMRGLYLVEGYPYPELDELESRGLTHVFYLDNLLLNNYDTVHKNLTSLFETIKTTNIQLIFVLNAFKSSNSDSLVDPTNIAHRTKLKTALSRLIKDFPDLNGISFKEFEWQTWDGYTSDEKSDILADFAKEIASTIKDLNPSIKFSASMNWRSSTLRSVSSQLDYGITEIFTSNSEGIPISKAIQTVKEYSKGDVVVELLTHDNAVNLDPRSLSDIYNEISTVIANNGPSYVLYASPWIPFGLGFPEVDYSFKEIYMDLNLVSKNKKIPERSSRIMAISFLDQNNDPPSPDLLKTVAGSYKITDQFTGKIIRDFTSFIPTNYVYELILTGEDNIIVNPDVSQENHVITVSIVYGNGRTENNELSVTVLNLLGIE